MWQHTGGFGSTHVSKCKPRFDCLLTCSCRSTLSWFLYIFVLAAFLRLVLDRSLISTPKAVVMEDRSEDLEEKKRSPRHWLLQCCLVHSSRHGLSALEVASHL